MTLEDIMKQTETNSKYQSQGWPAEYMITREMLEELIMHVNEIDADKEDE